MKGEFTRCPTDVKAQITRFLGGQPLNIIPCERESAYFPPHKNGVKEYIFVAQGHLQIKLENNFYELEHGDSMYFEANLQHRFKNIGDTECCYYLIIDSYDANI